MGVTRDLGFATAVQIDDGANAIPDEVLRAAVIRKRRVSTLPSDVPAEGEEIGAVSLNKMNRCYGIQRRLRYSSRLV